MAGPWEDEIEAALWSASAEIWATELLTLHASAGTGPFAVRAVTQNRTGDAHSVTFDFGDVDFELGGVDPTGQSWTSVDLVGGVQGNPEETVVAVRFGDGTWDVIAAHTIRCTPKVRSHVAPRHVS
jgi:hypothetical protein